MSELINIDHGPDNKWDSHLCIPSVDDWDNFGFLLDESGTPTGCYCTHPSDTSAEDWAKLVLELAKLNFPLLVATTETSGKEQIFQIAPVQKDGNCPIFDYGIDQIGKVVHSAASVFMNRSAISTPSSVHSS